MVAAGGECCATEAPPLPTPGCLHSADNHPAEDTKRTSDSPLTRQKTSKERGYRPRGERQHMDSFWTLVRGCVCFFMLTKGLRSINELKKRYFYSTGGYQLKQKVGRWRRKQRLVKCDCGFPVVSNTWFCMASPHSCIYLPIQHTFPVAWRN